MEELESDVVSDELMDFMSHCPNWLLRYGSLTLLFSLGVIVLFLFMIKFPEKIDGKIVITTTVPTVTIKNKIAGRIIDIYTFDNQIVNKNQKLLYLENNANFNDILELEKLIKTIQINKQSELVLPRIFKDSLILGDLNQYYQDLMLNIRQYQYIQSNNFYTLKNENISNQLQNYKQLSLLNKELSSLSKKELETGYKKHQIISSLYDQNVIPLIELNEEKQRFFAKQQQHLLTQKNELQNNITIEELAKQQLDIKHDREFQKQQLTESILRQKSAIMNAIQTWKNTYIVSSHSNGRINFIQDLKNNQYLNVNEPLFIVVPSHLSFVGITQVPITNSGKLKIGQKVLITLDSYNPFEFGKLKGKVTKIFSANNQNFFTLYISLTNGFESTLSKKIPFKPQMSGSVEIQLDQSSFGERVLKKVNFILNNNIVK